MGTELSRQRLGPKQGFELKRERTEKGKTTVVLADLRNRIIHLAKEVAPGLVTAVRRLGNCLSQALALLGLPQLE